MKPLALALAAAVLGTGCIIVDDDVACSSSTVTVQWPTFQLSNGTMTGCTGAGVDFVDVYVDGQFQDWFYCADGAGTVAAWAGSTVTVEGIDGLGRIAYRDWTTAGSGCGSHAAAVQPAEGIVNLNYSAPGGCSGGPCHLWFAVFDYDVNDFTSVIDSSSPASVQASFTYPDDVAIRLPIGSYRLEWMELVSSTFSGVALTCNTSGFDVAAAGTTDLPVTLLAACLP